MLLELANDGWKSGLNPLPCRAELANPKEVVGL